MIDAADPDHCRAAIRVGSLSFHTASRLLPARVREPALALYAFCRRKLALLLQSGLSVAAMSLLPRAATLRGAPRPEVAFLVEAAANPRRAPGRSEAVLTVLAQLRAQDRAHRDRRALGTATA